MGPFVEWIVIGVQEHREDKGMDGAETRNLRGNATLTDSGNHRIAAYVVYSPTKWELFLHCPLCYAAKNNSHVTQSTGQPIV